MASKECPNCKAVGKKKRLRHKRISEKGISRAFYVCDYCGFKTRA